MWLFGKSLARRTCSFVLSLLVLFSIFVPSQCVLADTEKNADTIDFVLVVDCSSSLTRTDPNKLTLQAAKKFVDMLPVNDTRLAVIAFGDNYGSAAYKINKNDKISENRVKLVCDLQDISGNKKSSIHNAIDKDITPKGDYSPLGYAYEAACQVLQKGDAAEGAAAIILLSDGQVEGQDDVFNKIEFDSIETANSIAASSKWPVYCMELNYANETGNGSTLGRIAYHQMRENIPVKTGTSPIELKSAEQAASEFEKIFAAMYPESEIIHDTGEIKNGKKEFTVPVSEMTAEQNITLTGDVSKFERIELISPSGDSTTLKSGSQSSDDTIISNLEKGYVSVKILTPEDGEWKVTVYGTDKVTIDLLSVGFKKTNLELSSSVPDGEIKAGTIVNFVAKYAYNGYAYTSDSFYKKHQAKLYINGKESVDMDAETDCYKASYTFTKKGTYKVTVSVEDDIFKNGRKDSNALSFTIENVAPQAVDQIADQETGILKETESINLRDYFSDDDALRYTVRYDKSVGLSHDIKGDQLALKGGYKQGKYEITIVADDGSEEKKAEQTFWLTVRNEPVVLLKDASETIELTYDKDDEKARQIKWADYFSDPDGLPPRIAIIEDSNDGIEWLEDDNQGGMTVRADASGNAVIEVIAVDYSDLTECQTVTFLITADGGWQKVVHDNKVLFGIGIAALIVLLAVLIAGFFGRKIYGTWDVGNEYDRVLSRVRSGKKSTCKLNNLLSDLGIDTAEGSFGNVTLKAGNNFSKAVYFTNLENLERVEKDDDPMEKHGKGDRVEIKPNHSIKLVAQNGSSIYMYRSKK